MICTSAAEREHLTARRVWVDVEWMTGAFFVMGLNS